MLAPLGSAVVVAQNGAEAREFVVRALLTRGCLPSGFWIEVNQRPESLTEHFHSNLQQIPFRSSTW